MFKTGMGDHLSVEVDAVVKNAVKSQKWRNGASIIRQEKLYVILEAGADLIGGGLL